MCLWSEKFVSEWRSSDVFYALKEGWARRRCWVIAARVIVMEGKGMYFLQFLIINRSKFYIIRTFGFGFSTEPQENGFHSHAASSDVRHWPLSRLHVEDGEDRYQRIVCCVQHDHHDRARRIMRIRDGSWWPPNVKCCMKRPNKRNSTNVNFLYEKYESVRYSEKKSWICLNLKIELNGREISETRSLKI